MYLEQIIVKREGNTTEHFDAPASLVKSRGVIDGDYPGVLQRRPGTIVEADWYTETVAITFLHEGIKP